MIPRRERRRRPERGTSIRRIVRGTRTNSPALALNFALVYFRLFFSPRKNDKKTRGPGKWKEEKQEKAGGWGAEVTREKNQITLTRRRGRLPRVHAQLILLASKGSALPPIRELMPGRSGLSLIMATTTTAFLQPLLSGARAPSFRPWRNRVLETLAVQHVFFCWVGAPSFFRLRGGQRAPLPSWAGPAIRPPEVPTAWNKTAPPSGQLVRPPGRDARACARSRAPAPIFIRGARGMSRNSAGPLRERV